MVKKYQKELKFYTKRYEIYNRKATVTIKIRIQGGIVAANGITSIFMVHSVLAISENAKVKRDANMAMDSRSRGRQAAPIFSQILEQKVDEQIQEAPTACFTTTYGQDSRLHTFQYQTREYNR